MKMKKRTAFAAILAAVALTVTGCGGDFPEMSDNEYNMVVNYAAGLLLRYAKGTTDRMTYLDASYTPEHLVGVQPEEEAPAPADTAGSQEAQTVPDVPVQEPVPDAPDAGDTSDAASLASDTPDMGGTDATAQAQAEDTGTEPAPQSGESGSQSDAAGIPVDRVSIEASSLQHIANGATVEYTGYSVRNAYPDSQTQGAVSAAYGDKLLVANFTIHNLTGDTIRFNTASLNPQFKLLINGDVQGFTMVTMIANDLSGMDAQIAPGGHTEAVLLMEVPEDLAKSVDTLDLMVVRGAELQTIRLE